MIDPRILRLTPRRNLCPLCGEWHDWEGKTLQSYDEDSPYSYRCNDADISIWADDSSIYIHVDAFCEKFDYEETNLTADLCEIEYDGTAPVIKIPFNLEAIDLIGSSECEYCEFCDECNLVQVSDQRDLDEDEYSFKLAFKFEFASRYFNKYSEADREKMLRQQREAEEAQRQQELARQREAEEAQRQQELARQHEAEEAKQQKKPTQQTKQPKEVVKVNEKKKNGLLTQLYEHSPKENVELVKAWATKYQPVLKWAIPVAAVYGAYRILNSPEFDLSVNNISETCEKKLGFKLELLDNKRALKELMAIGGICAGAYAAVNAISGVFGSQTEAKDITVEEVEAGMNQLESVSKKFAWIQPKTENMLPIACSVILVYVTLHKPKFSAKTTKKFLDLTEDFRIKLDIYIGLAKDFIQNKFQIDLSNEEEQRKFKICAFLVALMGVFAFLYGKKVLGDKTAPEETGDAKERNIRESAEAFIEQAKAIMEKIAPTVYTTLISILVSKKLLMLEEPQEITVDTSGPVILEEAHDFPAEEAPEVPSGK